jgi:hypothetical protein
MYSEQTLATTSGSHVASPPADSDELATLIRARAISAASLFSAPRIRWPFSSNRAMRFFVPGRV